MALLLFALCYLIGSVIGARQRPLWMDEILTLWTARMTSPGRIYVAIQHGSEYAPPVYPMLLFFLGKVVGYGTVAMRLPAIVANLVTGVACFSILRRHTDFTRAALGFCLITEWLYFTAMQIRPYAAVVACFAMALLVWERYNERRSWLGCVGIGTLLGLGISLHFYAVLLVACLGLIELFYSVRVRLFRGGLWAAIVLGGASIFIWLPLMRVMSRFTANETGGPAYYARPTLGAVVGVLEDLFLRKEQILLVLLPVLVLVGVGYFLRTSQEEPELTVDRSPASLWAMTFGLLLFPVIVFAFSKVVTHAFNERYAFAAVIGDGFLIATLLPVTRFFRRIFPAYLLLASLAFPVLVRLHSTPAQPDLALLVPGTEPVVVAGGLQFFPLVENSSVRRRITYLTLPDSVPVGDATNAHVIERWKVINPQLPIEDVNTFLQSHHDFYLIDDQSSDDTPAQYLLEHHGIELIEKQGMLLIYHSRHNGSVASPSPAP